VVCLNERRIKKEGGWGEKVEKKQPKCEMARLKPHPEGMTGSQEEKYTLVELLRAEGNLKALEEPIYSGPDKINGLYESLRNLNDEEYAILIENNIIKNPSIKAELLAEFAYMHVIIGSEQRDSSVILEGDCIYKEALRLAKSIGDKQLISSIETLMKKTYAPNEEPQKQKTMVCDVVDLICKFDDFYDECMDDVLNGMPPSRRDSSKISDYIFNIRSEIDKLENKTTKAELLLELAKLCTKLGKCYSSEYTEIAEDLRSKALSLAKESGNELFLSLLSEWCAVDEESSMVN
jgi:hypothetical protein